MLALAALIAQEQPAHGVFAHTYQTRDFVPTLAARLDRALVTDCTSFKDRDGGSRYSRPIFQGKLTADVAPEGRRHTW